MILDNFHTSRFDSKTETQINNQLPIKLLIILNDRIHQMKTTRWLDKVITFSLLIYEFIMMNAKQKLSNKTHIN
jgi:hypothetical protein